MCPQPLPPLPDDIALTWEGREYHAEPDDALRLLHRRERFSCEGYKNGKFLRLIK
jgi:hypothetical protein